MMQLQKKPNQWSCSIAAFAMACDVPIHDFMSMVGHDGSEVVFPELPEPMCRRGFHVQELIQVALAFNKTVTPFELIPAIQSTPYPGCTPRIITIESDSRRVMFNLLVNTFRGVLTGRGIRCHHAVAFDNGQVFDPDGAIYPFSFRECERRRFFAQCVWIVHPLNS
jgi:hypothetical protein